jgi:hypothetical protein
VQQPTLDVSVCPCCGSISLATIEMDAIEGPQEFSQAKALPPNEAAAKAVPHIETMEESQSHPGVLFFECLRCHWQGNTATLNII